MSEKKEQEKAGAKAPAASSKVEETQKVAAVETSKDAELAELKAQITEKDEKLASKDAELAKLKEEVTNLKNQLSSIDSKSKGKKGKPGYFVTAAFRDKESKDGKILGIGTDVSHFKAERLEDLVNRGLVTKA